MAFERDVFINCPFDAAYEPIFDGILFTIVRSGFRPRTSLEADDGAENRLGKIAKIIRECPFAVHDISRTESGGDPPLPRFNMPLELGMFMGAKLYGSSSLKKKQCLIFDVEPYRYQQFISDIAGQDIKAHRAEPERAIEQLSAWLRNHSGMSGVPGAAIVAAEFDAYRQALPELCAARQIRPAEVKFNDKVALMSAFVTLVPPA
jgi:hypothetical protein